MNLYSVILLIALASLVMARRQLGEQTLKDKLLSSYYYYDYYNYNYNYDYSYYYSNYSNTNNPVGAFIGIGVAVIIIICSCIQCCARAARR